MSPHDIAGAALYLCGKAGDSGRTLPARHEERSDGEWLKDMFCNR